MALVVVLQPLINIVNEEGSFPPPILEFLCFCWLQPLYSMREIYTLGEVSKILKPAGTIFLCLFTLWPSPALVLHSLTRHPGPICLHLRSTRLNQYPSHPSSVVKWSQTIGQQHQWRYRRKNRAASTSAGERGSPSGMWSCGQWNSLRPIKSMLLWLQDSIYCWKKLSA